MGLFEPTLRYKRRGAKITADMVRKRRLFTLESIYSLHTTKDPTRLPRFANTQYPIHNLTMSNSELAASYAALILADEDIGITVSADRCWGLESY